MRVIIVVIISFFSVLNLKAQKPEFNKSINKDSLFNAIVECFTEDRRHEIIEAYKESNEQSKEFLLFMLTMPRSSKKELIENYKGKESEILKLKSEYLKLVPEKYIVDIEFEPENRIFNLPKTISLKILRKNEVKQKSSISNLSEVERNDGLEVISENWNLTYDSKVLEREIERLNWTHEILLHIKKMLDAANCISIKNGEFTNIGFSRSGMGKYSYNIFDKDLTEEQIAEYNDGCTFIFYQHNIVLEYCGGAVGPQRFENE